MKLYAVRIGTIRMKHDGATHTVEATGRYRTMEFTTTKGEAVKRAKAIHKEATYPQCGWAVVEASVPNNLKASEWAECLSFDAPGDAGFITFMDLVELGDKVAESKR